MGAQHAEHPAAHQAPAEYAHTAPHAPSPAPRRTGIVQKTFQGELRVTTLTPVSSYQTAETRAGIPCRRTHSPPHTPHAPQRPARRGQGRGRHDQLLVSLCPHAADPRSPPRQRRTHSNLALDLPQTSAFKDDESILPQIPLMELLNKFDGVREQVFVGHAVVLWRVRARRSGA